MINDLIFDIVAIIKSVGAFGGFILVWLESIIPVLPLSVFIGLNILSFGTVLGFVISYIASVVGCVCSFILFRYLFRNKCMLFIKNKDYKRLNNIILKVSNIEFKYLVMIIACPFTPAYFVNIAAGVSNLSFKKYIISIVVGKIFLIYFWGYVGVNFLESIKNPIVLVKIFIIILLAYLISEFIEKIFIIEEN